MYAITVPYFDLDQIYKSGQGYTWIKCSDNKYVVPYKDKAVKVQQKGEHVAFNCTEEEFYDIWWDYFDLGTDYSIINNKYKYIGDEIRFKMNRCSGLHIVNHDLFETIIFSILEASTSIQRTRQMMLGIAQKCGKRHANSMSEIGVVKWYEFPTPRMILKNKHKLTTNEVGYKMEYIEGICQAIVDGWLDFDTLRCIDTEDAIEYLTEFKGIGRKVAESICLFGLHRMECFPIDTHMNKFFDREFSITPDEWLDKNIHNTNYEKHAGYLRQSLFYSELYPPLGPEEYEDIKVKKIGKRGLKT